MNTRIIVFILTGLFLFPQISGSQTKPELTMNTSGRVNDIVYREGLLVAATDAGIVDVFDVNKGTLNQQIQLPAIADFMGDPYTPSVLSIDYLPKANRYLLVSEGAGGKRNVWIKEYGLLRPIFKETPMQIKKARFIGESWILFGLVDNELILYDYIKGKQIYRKQVSLFLFSDFALDDNGKLIQAAILSETGEVVVVDVLSGTSTNTAISSGSNRTNALDYGNGIIISGNQDNQVLIHDISSGLIETYMADSPVFAVGISPLATRGAFQKNASGDFSIIDLIQKKITATISGQSSAISNIIFIDEIRLISTTENKMIQLWKISK